MWAPSRRHHCLAFLMVCVLSAISFVLHLHQGLFQNALDLSALRPDRHLQKSPVAFVCLLEHTTGSQHFLSSLSGTA
uniref:Uncharacterized protein n=1 Tax=Castor canadensis TaxID=51338 RepID=A0A8C0X404_CASCN